MTTFIPSANRDHQIDIVDPEDSSTWIVLKGTKTIPQIVKEEIENPTREYVDDKGTPLTRGQKDSLQTAARTKYGDNTISIP